MDLTKRNIVEDTKDPPFLRLCVDEALGEHTKRFFATGFAREGFSAGAERGGDRYLQQNASVRHIIHVQGTSSSCSNPKQIISYPLSISPYVFPKKCKHTEPNSIKKLYKEYTFCIFSNMYETRAQC